MLDEFRRFIDSKRLLDAGQRVLLGVSGGIDSMVMLHLFHRLGTPVAVAHCHFGLRGKASDADQAFVKKQCGALGIPLYTKKFNTARAARQQGVSVQMAARALRLAYFDELMKRHRMSRVALAHHLDDSAETVLLNLVRGTGLAGLQGIVPRSGSVIRPLLFAARKEIAAYAKKEKIAWREDRSNRTDAYARNRIRRHVMPVLAGINPSVLEAFSRHSEAAADAEALYREYVAQLRDGLVREQGGEWRIDTETLASHAGAATLLFELLRGFGFNRTAAAGIYRAIGQPAGRVFLAPGYQLVTDRKALLLRRAAPAGAGEHVIRSDMHRFDWNNRSIGIRRLALTHDLKKSILEGRAGAAGIAWADAAKVEFPLVLRPWKAGDFFYPLGLKGRKKLSDFLTDRKYPLLRKRDTWLLLSGGRVVWVVGERLDDRFKIDERSKSCLELICEKQ
jgi:tRNA(Ile)-lysidine synthase